MGVHFSQPGSTQSHELLVYRPVTSYDVDELFKIKTESPDAAERRTEVVHAVLKNVEREFWAAHKFESAPEVAEVVTKSSWLGLVKAREVRELDDPKEVNAGATTMWLGDRTGEDEHNRTLVLLNRPYFGISELKEKTSRGAVPDTQDDRFSLPTEMAIISYDARIDFVKRSRRGLVVTRKPTVHVFWVTLDQRTRNSQFIDSVEKLVSKAIAEGRQGSPAPPPDEVEGERRPDSRASSVASRPDSRDSQASSGSFVGRFFRGLMGGASPMKQDESESAESESEREARSEQESGSVKRNPTRFGRVPSRGVNVDVVRKDLQFKDSRQREVLNYIFETLGAVLREQKPQPDIWKKAFPRSHSQGRQVPGRISSRNLFYYADLDTISPNALVALEVLLRGGNLDSASAKEFSSLDRRDIAQAVKDAVQTAGSKHALYSRILKKAKMMQAT